MARAPLPGSANGYELKKMSYTHDAIIDYIIENPMHTEIEIADHFKYSKIWISRLICSDGFQAALAKRKEEIINPALIQTVEERVRGTTLAALDVIDEKLETTRDPKLAIQFLEVTAKAAGYGARGQQVNVQNNTWVVPMPPTMQSSAEWEKAHQRPEGGILIEGETE